MPYKINIEITDESGRKVWGADVPADRKDIFEPRMATPGLKSVADYLKAVSKQLETAQR